MTPSAAQYPLAGRRVVVTRAAQQADDLVSRLEALGADVMAMPALEVVPLPSAPLDTKLARLSSFDWLVLTSANGVDVLAGRMRDLDVAIDAATKPKVAAIGDATARRLADAGIPVDLVPERAIAESLLDALVVTGVAGKRVLLPVAEGARDVLAVGLRAAGARVEVVATYRTERPTGPATDDVAAIRSGAVDVVVFASPSAVRNTVEIVGQPFGPGVAVACIGPVTAAAARALQLEVAIEAAEHSIPGLVEAIVAWATAPATHKEELDVAR